MQTTPAYDTYWRFAAERQAMLFRRLKGDPPPWTDDPILAAHRFTNAYRVLDRASQFLIRHVIYRQDLPSDAEEVFFRILLFKLFNKIDTWKLLEAELGPPCYSRFDPLRYGAVLGRAKKVYGAAYIMPPAGRGAKYIGHLLLLGRMMADGLPGKVAAALSLEEVFLLLREYPGIGNFLAYQFSIDINYSEITDFSEDDFVVAGPGAKEGIQKCFSAREGMTDEDIIRYMAGRQEEEFARLGLEFRSLPGRRLRLIDCQNLFCETGKYARLAHPDLPGKRKRIKQRYRHNPEPLEVWLPPKWKTSLEVNVLDAARDGFGQ